MPNLCPQQFFVGCCDPSTGFCGYGANNPGCVGPGSYSWISTNPNFCSPTPCPPIVTGLICCDPCTGACVLGTANGCPVNWAGFGGTTCTPNPCPPGTCPSVCCLSNGSCLPIPVGGSCVGTVLTGTATCAPVNPCVVPGCCDPISGACLNISPCPANWLPVTNCTPNTCPPGAQVCCDVFLNCSPFTGSCVGQVIPSATCTPNPCFPPLTGACCQTCGAGCSIVPQSQCPNSSLFFVSQPCSPLLCPQGPLTGACCLNPPGCIMASSCDCIRKGGTWLGATVCNPVACAAEVSGACCDFVSSTCNVTTQTTCQLLGYAFSGGSACSTFVNCNNPPPACCCCGACTDLDPLLCALAGGATQPGQVCASSPFVCNPNGGACCDPANGLCSIVTNANACISITGLPGLFYLGQTCSQIPPCAPPSGACCDLFTGMCVGTPAALCNGPFFQFISGGVCTPNPCVATAGACCQPNLVCIPVANAAACNGTFMGVGVSCVGVNCTPPFIICCDTTTAMCFPISAPGPCPFGSLQSTAGTCTPFTCPPVGACCQFGGSFCTITIQLLCAFPSNWTAGGSCSPNSCIAACCNLQTGACTPIFTSAQPCSTPFVPLIGQACSPNPCPPPPVVCCDTTTGVCSLLTTTCPSGTVPVTSPTLCTPNPCPPPGPCCIGAFCVPITQALCVSNGGTWGPPNASCALLPPNPCSGACCSPNGACSMVPLVSCPSPSNWISGGTCNPSSCPGACCDPATGQCQILSIAQCSAPQIFVGAGSTCPTIFVCVPGACCDITSGLCSIVTSAFACVTPSGLQGLFLGLGSVCPVTPCGTGACCLPNGQCVITTQFNCAGPNGNSGFWLGIGTACTPSSCIGRCCTPGGCGALNPIACLNAGGTWAGSGTNCKGGGVGCFGACCAFNGTCSVTSASQCINFGSQWLGGGTACTPTNPCISGTCCLPPLGGGLGSVCLQTNFIGCFTTPGGQWQGYGTTCQTPPNSGNFVACCKANWNKSGGVTIQDLFEFINCWFCPLCQGQPGSPCYGMTADFDGNSIIDINDIFMYLNAWFNGCS